MKSRRKRGGALTGNLVVDENLHQVARNEKILQSLGGSKRKRKTRKKNVGR